MLATKTYSRKVMILKKQSGEYNAVVMPNVDSQQESMRLATLLANGTRKGQIDLREALSILQGRNILTTLDKFDYLD
jgi:hypothetical protein